MPAVLVSIFDVSKIIRKCFESFLPKVDCLPLVGDISTFRNSKDIFYNNFKKKSNFKGFDKQPLEIITSGFRKTGCKELWLKSFKPYLKIRSEQKNVNHESQFIPNSTQLAYEGKIHFFKKFTFEFILELFVFNTKSVKSLSILLSKYVLITF